MILRITVPSHAEPFTVDTDGVDIDVWDAVEQEFKVSWASFNPWRSAKEAKAARKLICDVTGIDPAELKTVRQFAEAVEFVGEDDRPTEYSDGVPPQAGEDSTT